MKKELVLILGGARSGKSAMAKKLAGKMGQKVVFIATAEAGDAEMRQRIIRHKADRPAGWKTIEEPRKIVDAVKKAGEYDTVIIDCLTLWVNNHLPTDESGLNFEESEKTIRKEILELVGVYEKGKSSLIIVSGELGMGVVPSYPIGRAFRDILGRVNQMIAAKADRVYLMVAGIALDVKKLGDESIEGLL